MKTFVVCLVLCTIGVPRVLSQDSPEVAAAKAAHFEAVRRAELVIANSPSSGPVTHNEYRPPVVETAQHKLGLNVHDTPEVAAAKVAHYEAVREAAHATAVANATANGVHDSGHYIASPPTPIQPYTAPVQQHYTAPVQQHYTAPVQHHYNPQHYSAPVVHTSQHQLGVNVHDTPEVAAAKAAHYEAVRRAEQSAVVSGRYDDGSYVRYQEPAPVAPIVPVVPTSGQIQYTPEVAAARAAHYEALRRAELTPGPRYVEPVQPHYVPMPHHVMFMPVSYNIDYSRTVPVMNVPQTNQHKLGINVHDTPEVAAAKAAHFEAFRRAQLVAAEEEQRPNNNFYANTARQYGQV